MFANAPCVRYIAVPKELSRTEVQALENQAKSWGAKGLAYLVFRADGEVARRSRSSSRPSCSSGGAQPGHTLLFGADDPRVVAKVLGLLRTAARPRARPRRRVALEVPLGRRHARRGVGRAGGALDRGAPSVHAPDRRQHRDLQDRSGRGARGRVRPRRQRDRARRRLVQDPRAVAAAAGLREPRHRRGGAAREVRLPARRARDGRAAARRHRVRASTG